MIPNPGSFGSNQLSVQMRGNISERQTIISELAYHSNDLLLAGIRYEFSFLVIETKGNLLWSFVRFSGLISEAVAMQSVRNSGLRGADSSSNRAR